MGVAGVSRPNDSVDEGNVPSIVHAAMRQELALWPEKRAAIVSRVASLQTRADAEAFLLEARDKVKPHRADSAVR